MAKLSVDRLGLLDTIRRNLNAVEQQTGELSAKLGEIFQTIEQVRLSMTADSEQTVEYIRDLETAELRGVQFAIGREIATVSLPDCGFLEMEDDHHDVIMIEYRSGIPYLVYWPDINSSESTVVSLERAMIRNRKDA